MKYNKIVEVSEDTERVYFAFFINNYEKKIIGVPKKNCNNKYIYAGTEFSSLSIVDNSRAKSLLSELMKRTLLYHPAAQNCNHESIVLLSL